MTDAYQERPCMDIVAVFVGMLLGNLVLGPLLFRPSSGGPPDHPPRN